MDQDREERVRMRAYEIWEREGRQEGSHEAHWQQAEQEELRDENPGEREQEEDSSSQAAAGEQGGATSTKSADAGAKGYTEGTLKEDPTRLDLGGKTR